MCLTGPRESARVLLAALLFTSVGCITTLTNPRTGADLSVQRARTAGTELPSVDVQWFVAFDHLSQGLSVLDGLEDESVGYEHLGPAFSRELRRRGVTVRSSTDPTDGQTPEAQGPIRIRGFLSPRLVVQPWAPMQVPFASVGIREFAVVLHIGTATESVTLRAPVRIRDTRFALSFSGWSEVSKPGVEVAAGMAIQELQRRRGIEQ